MTGTLTRGSWLPLTTALPMVCWRGAGFSTLPSPRCAWLLALIMREDEKRLGLIRSLEGTTISRWSSPVRYGSADGHDSHPMTCLLTTSSSSMNEGPARSYPGCTAAVSR